MNIFVLDTCPTVAAQMQCDKHVVKMPLECAQMLSTVHRAYGSDDVALYKATHKHHPCTLWAAQSTANYYWLYDHFKALAYEYTHRYFKTHLSWSKLRDVVAYHPALMRDNEPTPFAQAMPDEYKHDDAVTAYRAYYVNEKAKILTYSRRDKPSWLTS